jgi:hypothetical protein
MVTLVQRRSAYRFDNANLKGRAAVLELQAELMADGCEEATAGLFVRTFQQLTRVPLGFEGDRVLSVMITAPHVAPSNRNRLYLRLVDTIAALPDVSSAGGVLADPLRRFGVPIAFRVPGARRFPDAETLSYGNDITPGWRAAYGTPLRAGRDIDDRDANGALPVMLVNETFVERFFPGENIMGRTLAVTAHIPPDGEISLGARTVVGIVADAVHDSIRSPKRPIIYRPLAQREGPLFIPLYIAVRPATGSPAEQSNDVVVALHAVDPMLRISARTVADGVDRHWRKNGSWQDCPCSAAGSPCCWRWLVCTGSRLTLSAVDARKSAFGWRWAVRPPALFGL